MRKKLDGFTVVIALSANLALGVGASVFFEDSSSGDTGDSIPTAIIVPGGIDQIDGILNTGTDYDLWGFFLGEAQILTLDLGNSSFDDNLILFNSDGNGLEGDDDGAGGLDSRISRSLDAGRYFIGVGPNNMAGFTEAGVEFINNDSGSIAGGTTAKLGRIGNEGNLGGSHGQAGATYTLTFSTETVPEPSSGLLLGTCCLWLAARRRR